MSTLRSPYGLLVRVCLAAVATAASVGCIGVKPVAGPNACTEAGVVMMDWRTARALQVVEHTCARNGRDRLDVTVEFYNLQDENYRARLRVRFADEYGRHEKDAYDTDEVVFPAGRTRMAWTSSSVHAESYVLELRSARVLQW